eukprot:1252821-Rhodomonas_salina.2
MVRQGPVHTCCNGRSEFADIRRSQELLASNTSMLPSQFFVQAAATEGKGALSPGAWYCSDTTTEEVSSRHNLTRIECPPPPRSPVSRARS